MLVIVKSAYGQYQSFTSTISSAFLLPKGWQKTVQVKILKKCLLIYPVTSWYVSLPHSYHIFSPYFMTLQQPIKSKENHYFLGMLKNSNNAGYLQHTQKIQISHKFILFRIIDDERNCSKDSTPIYCVHASSIILVFGLNLLHKFGSSFICLVVVLDVLCVLRLLLQRNDIDSGADDEARKMKILIIFF